LGDRHSVILSSHILPEIQSLCDRVMIINHGRVVYSETIEAATATRSEAAILGFSRAPDHDALCAVPGVGSATALQGGQWRVEFTEGADPREALAAAAVRAGWGLVELRPVVKTLEERFVELTTGEDSHKEAA
ncbi:MAG TPA: ABC transporter ATP-binding protein, partial [Nevskiaceae bacterium]